MKTDLLKDKEHLRTRCTIYTRVMGYHRPVESFNTGKVGEHKNRKQFVLSSEGCKCNKGKEGG